MITINAVKEFLGVDGQYTGKDRKIAIAENYWSGYAYADFELPLGIDSFVAENSKHPHNYASCWIAQQMAPDAKVYLIPPTLEGFAWAYENDIDIVSMSLSKSIAGPLIESKLAEKAFLICAAGNDGDSEDPIKRLESEASHTGFYCPVGAADFNDGKPTIQDYSAFGDALVKTCGIDGIEVPYYGTFYGTSCGAPMVAGLMACFSEWFESEFDTKPHINHFYKYIRKASIDIALPGFDLKTGYGVLSQKFDPNMFDVTTLSVGSNKGHINGKQFELINAPFIKNDKAQVELTALRQCGVGVGWDNGKITIVR